MRKRRYYEKTREIVKEDGSITYMSPTQAAQERKEYNERIQKLRDEILVLAGVSL